jgi:hypothetical protein
MAMSTHERVDTLGNALKELAYAGRRTEMSIDRLSEQTQQTTANLESLSAELKEGAREANVMKREANEQWGRLANKMGTFIEDVVVPNFPHILERYFGIAEVEDQLVRRRKPHPTERAKKKEFDLIAWTSDTVFWNETKSNATVEAFSAFVRDDESVFEYFPELTGRKLVKIASALSMPKELVDETMDPVNFSAVR